MREGVAAALRLARGAALPDALGTGDPAAWLELDEGVRAMEWYRLPVAGAGWERSAGERALLTALAAGDPLSDARPLAPLIRSLSDRPPR
ncbi:hypothetical protein [Streptomyces sp. NPDC005890]|uniref:hypothetical protein n=1 Tax=Streptomyces sp. NPDC005890 TaxID=3154568 RepID=UPI0033E46FF9